MKNSIIVGATIAILASTGFAAPAEVAVSWTGPAAGGLYSLPTNWSGGQVPINTKLDLYNVTLSATGTITMDVDTPVSVQDLILGTGQTFKISRGHAFTVKDDAQINGVIEVQNSSFIADQPGAAFGGSNNARLVASGGGLIRIAATQYSSTSLSDATLMNSNGAGTLIDLSALQFLNAGFNYGNYTTVQRVKATAGGVVDLSGVQTLISPVESYDRIEFTMSSDGLIDLSALQEVYSAGGGVARFNIQLPVYEFPSLVTASRVEILPSAGSAVTLPMLTWADRMVLTVPTSASVAMPEVVSVKNSTLTVADGGAFSAPNLVDFQGNSITISSGQQLEFPSFENIDNSRIVLRDGASLSSSVTQYSSRALADAALLDASGVGSEILLQNLRTFDAGFSYGNYTTVQVVEASAGGLVDLSALETLISPAESYDRIEFILSGGGAIDLSSLREIRSASAGAARFTVQVPTFALPSLVSAARMEIYPSPGCAVSLPALEQADRLTISIPTGATISMPSVVSVRNSTISVAGGGTLLAPSLIDFVNNSIGLTADQHLDFPAFQNIDQSRFSVTGGATLVADVMSYSSNALTAAVLLQASGVGSRIDLASLLSINAGFCYGNYETVQTVKAEVGAEIDLSAVQTITTPCESYDRIEFDALSGGSVLLSNFRNVTSTGSGHCRFVISGSGSFMDLGYFGTFAFAGQYSQTGGSESLLGPVVVSGSGTMIFNDDVSGSPSAVVRGSFLNNSTAEASVKTDDAIMTMESRYALFEAASTDQGVSGLTGQNFQIGRFLVDPPPVGEQLVDAPAMIVFVDNFDNGNRSGPTGHECVYFTGLNGTSGIIALHGGTLVLNGLHVYTYKNGQWIDLQQGLPAVGAIPFLDGFIANRLEDTIGDFNGSRCVDGEDLGRLLGAWGTADAVCDINGSGLVDGADLGLLLGRWGCD